MTELAQSPMGGWRDCFPWSHHPTAYPNQERGLEIISKNLDALNILELPTGSGKTAIGYTFLKILEKKGLRHLFYITPTKTLVNQVKAEYDVKVVYGRNEYPCLYYKNKSVRADECACSILDCAHRIDAETGETQAAGVEPCPYLRAKFLAGQGGIVVCTTAFYLYSQLFQTRWGKAEGLVVDEAHRVAQIVRSCLSYEITDYHLKKGIEFLEEISVKETGIIKDFLKKMNAVVKSKPQRQATLLEAHEIRDLLDDLSKLDPKWFDKNVREAVRVSGLFADEEHQEALKKVETLTRDLTRYYRSLEYSLPTGQREALNYTFGYCEGEIEKGKKIGHRLHIKAYYVAPIIRRILPARTLTYSATIGNVDVFSMETGIKGSFHVLPSNFPVENTRIFMPTDTPDLAMKNRRRDEPRKTLKRVAKACQQLAQQGIRSLVVIVSEVEKKEFLARCQDIGVNAISYGNGVTSREAVTRFKNGEGDILVGTFANYGEGLDLPRQIAPVIFVLRPNYPSPTDPATVFEERRFRGMRWRIWNWRVMIGALQVRGRNIRSAKDLGVTIFISQQFKRFLYATLPETLEVAYQGNLRLDECTEATLKLLKEPGKN